ncbi:Cytochrome P450 [Amycolatopsis xylanica]|uniref:Cytochrome P450 n=1 Tax=Amycolatopsis xylanica TaxID=589385 RepID=A0A1H3LYL4_9PSEU|nr:cytochrome P450 [Amycolatopsis xylanica]SDY69532.1 Cytochrome P450 [Amycolatopsis xylanica]
MTDVAGSPTLAWPMERVCPFGPPAEYQRLRAEEPVTKVRLASGMTIWAVSRLEDIRQLLTDPRFSSDRHAPGFPRIIKDQKIIPGFRSSLIDMDAPEHGEKRREVLSEFTIRRVKAMAPRVQQIVDERIDAILDGPKPADLVKSLALPVPSLVICELLGVPYHDHEFFESRTYAMLSRDKVLAERQAAFGELLTFLDELVTAKEAEPTDDLLGRLILKQRAGGGVRHQDLKELAFLLLVAGHETTANMTSLGVLTLLEHPDQLKKIVEDPSKTLGAIEELLRFLTIAEAAGLRVAIDDVEIGGQLIRAGEGVIALTISGNRDAEAFVDPDEFDIERSARHHVAFGFGIHQCLGANLARLELQIIFDTLFRRIPGLRLAVPAAELPYKTETTIYGLHELPVTW